MNRARRLLGSTLLLFAAPACERPEAAAPAPTAEIRQRAVLALLPGLQFGADPARDAYREIRAVEVAGAHFVPSENRWVVHYCVEYTNFESEAPLRRCDVRVEMYELDTKKWIGFARGAGSLYRWQVIAPAPPNEAKSDGAAGSAAP